MCGLQNVHVQLINLLHFTLDTLPPWGSIGVGWCNSDNFVLKWIQIMQCYTFVFLRPEVSAAPLK